MQPVMQLVWKEWREQRMWAALGCFILVGFTVVGLQARVVEDAIVMFIAALLGTVVLPVGVAMGLVAPERGERTLGALLTLPVPAWVTLGVKTLVGALVVVLPLAAEAAVAVAMAGGRELPIGLMLGWFRGAAAFGVLVMVWTMVVGIRLRGEAMVGVAGASLLLTFAVLAMGMDRFLDPSTATALLPLRPVTLHAGGVAPHIGAHWPQGLMAMAAWGVAAWQFGRLGRTRG